MQKTIKFVSHETREWNGPNGTLQFVSGSFDDGGEWSIGCKPENVQTRIAELEALIGKPLEGFVIEPSMDKKTGRQREYHQRLQWTLKQQQQNGYGGGGNRSGGGGRPYVESYGQSKECKAAEQRSITRSVALKHAVEFGIANKQKVTEILQVANAMFSWLLETSAPDPAAMAPPQSSYQPPPPNRQPAYAGPPDDSEIPF